jgi:intraflagellar transport protein 88
MGDRLRTAETGTANLGRPSTAVRPVGFSSEAMGLFDPFNQAAKKTVVLENKKEET